MGGQAVICSPHYSEDNAEGLCDLLNELADENEMLREELFEMRSKNCDGEMMKMIEKRFVTNEVGCIVDLKDPQLRNYDGEEIVDLLNELAEENDGLKQYLAHLKVLYHSLEDKYSGLLRIIHWWFLMIEFLLIIISLLLFCLYLNALTERNNYKRRNNQLNRINKEIKERIDNNIVDLYLSGKISSSLAYYMCEMSVEEFHELYERKKEQYRSETKKGR